MRRQKKETLAMMKATPRMTEGEKSRRIAQCYKGSSRIYYLYQRCSASHTYTFTDASVVKYRLINGTNEKVKAKALVAQHEAMGHTLIVYCAKPKQGTSVCVYKTGETVEG